MAPWESWGTGLWNLEEAGPPGVSLGHPAHPRDLYSKGSNEVGMSLDSESSSHLLYEPGSQGSFLQNCISAAGDVSELKSG